MLLDVVRWGPNKTLGVVHSLRAVTATREAYANDIEAAVEAYAREHGL